MLPLIAALLLLYGLHAAAGVLIPVMLAGLLGLLLQPTVLRLRRIGLPDAASAALIVLLLLGLFGSAVGLLAQPAEEWMQRLPDMLRQVEAEMRDLEGPLDEVREVSKQAETIAGPRRDPETPRVTVQEQSWFDQIMQAAPLTLVGVAMVVFLLFFFLAAGDELIRGAATACASFGMRRRVLRIASQVRSHVSQYLFTVTLINIALGAAIGLAMHLLDMPSPWLWGAAAIVLNYAPYVGALTGVLTVGLVSTLTFDTPLEALLPPATYLLLTALEGHVITPLILGQRFSLNPLVVFLSLVIGGWLWGVAGVLMAVPLLASAKIVCEQVPRLQPAVALLAGRPRMRRRRDRASARGARPQNGKGSRSA